MDTIEERCAAEDAKADIRNGLTPKVVEAAYTNHTIRDTAARLQVPMKHFRPLAIRWGIIPEPAAKKKPVGKS